MDRKIGKFFMILAALVILVVVIWLMFPAAPPPAKPLPNPNGYTKLVEAGRMLAGGSFDYKAMSREELQDLVGSYSNALALARAGLQEECRIPLQYSMAYLTVHMDELGGFKKLGQTLAAEGRLAELEERHGDAAKCYLDVVHLGTEAGRGGVLIDGLVGMAVEAIGTGHLQALAGRLNAKTCRETAAALESFDAQRESWTEVMQQEREWSRRAYPGLRYRLATLFSRRSLKQAEEKGKSKFNDQVGRTRRLTLDLAARAYELEKGHRPGTAADLVPEYLQAVPQDPITGTNLVYAP
jgi:hypothetical protein